MQILGATLCDDEITSFSAASKVQDCDDSATALEMSLSFPVSLRKHIRSIRHFRLSSSGDGCQRQLKT